jgi:hypothetical protein
MWLTIMLEDGLRKIRKKSPGIQVSREFWKKRQNAGVKKAQNGGDNRSGSSMRQAAICQAHSWLHS